VLVLLLVLGGIIWIRVARSLRPLTRLTAQLRQRRPFALDSLPEQGLPEELQPLVEALNELLGRLHDVFEGQRRFIADAAHELRTPITAVRLQAQVLQLARRDEERTQALQQVRAGIARASHLVSQLLTLARLEPGGQAPAFELVDLGTIVKEVVAEQAPAAVKRNIDLGVSECEPVVLCGDPEGLRVLLGNLLTNALRYSPAGGRVDVVLRRESEQARLDVVDNGPGIPPAERERVFERFYRRPGSEGDGSGLGLAIVREIVARHLGAIELTDVERSSGLRVSVRLPFDTDQIDR